jgi:acylphosphatase
VDRRAARSGALSARRIRIEGRVQGVFYRDWTIATARALGLSGWVRNRRDGSVEALAIGTDDAIGQMIAACHDGPPQARVERVTVEDAAENDSVTGFSRRPTA